MLCALAKARIIPADIREDASPESAGFRDRGRCGCARRGCARGALRDRTTAEEARDGRAATAAATDEGEASAPRLPAGPLRVSSPSPHPAAASFGPSTSARAECSTSPGWRRVACLTPRASEAASRSPLIMRALRRGASAFLVETRGRASESTRGLSIAWVPIAWGPDGSTLAWCDSLRSGFELSRSQRPKRLDHCPRAYDPSGVTAYVNDRQIVIDGRPLLRADRHLWRFAWGVDGSLAVVVDGQSTATRVDAWWARRACPAGDARPHDIATLRPATGRPLGRRRRRQAGRPRLLPGPGAADVQRLVADWSPDGKWIVVAEPDAVVFHRVVGREASVRWNVVAGDSPGSAVGRAWADGATPPGGASLTPAESAPRGI